MKFKVGDKVKSLESDDDIDIGKIYLIIKDGDRVNFRDNVGCSRSKGARNYQLIKKGIEKIKEKAEPSSLPDSLENKKQLKHYSIDGVMIGEGDILKCFGWKGREDDEWIVEKMENSGQERDYIEYELFAKLLPNKNGGFRLSRDNEDYPNDVIIIGSQKTK